MKIEFRSFLGLICLTTSLGLGQDTFEAIPQKSIASYHINFEKWFFKSPATERDSYLLLEAMLIRLEAYKGKVASSRDNLLSALLLNDSIIVENYFHDAYLYLRYAVNTNDEQSSERESEMNAEVNRRTAFLQQELVQIPKTLIDRYIHEKPELKPYLFGIESASRFRTHTLSLVEEEKVGQLSPSIIDWQYQLYENLVRHIDFTKIKTKEGKELNVWTQRGVIQNHMDRSVRESGFKNRFTDFAKQRDLFAFTLLKLIKGRNALSQVHHFKNFPEESYFARYLDNMGVANLLKTVNQYVYLVKKYESIRAEHIKKMSGYAEINYWDISVGGAGSTIPRFNISRATDVISEAVQPLGNEYESEMLALLDPSNGRLDIVSGDNRLAGGGGTGFPGIPNVFYSHGYEGYYKDVSVLIHEGGHVVHFQLMGKNNVKAIYGSGPNYFSESFSIFNELLLADYLFEHEKDRPTKVFYLEQFLDVKGLEIFRGAQDAELEQAVYDSVEKDKIQNADDLDTLSLGILSRYSIWPNRHPDQFKGTWMVSRLLYEDPLYLVNYLYGGLLSLKYYDLYKKDPKDFSQKYLALMRNGFNDTPSLLLKKYLDIDLNDPQLLRDAMKLIENKIDDLQVLYNEVENK